MIVITLQSQVLHGQSNCMELCNKINILKEKNAMLQYTRAVAGAVYFGALVINDHVHHTWTLIDCCLCCWKWTWYFKNWKRTRKFKYFVLFPGRIAKWVCNMILVVQSLHNHLAKRYGFKHHQAKLRWKLTNKSIPLNFNCIV